jgi:hypothetical protein
MRASGRRTAPVIVTCPFASSGSVRGWKIETERVLESTLIQKRFALHRTVVSLGGGAGLAGVDAANITITAPTINGTRRIVDPIPDLGCAEPTGYLGSPRVRSQLMAAVEQLQATAAVVSSGAFGPVDQDYLVQARQMQALCFAAHIPLVCVKRTHLRRDWIDVNRRETM